MSPDLALSVRVDDRAAPLWRRLAAIAYDLLIVVALMMALTTIAIMARGGRSIDSGSFWFQLLLIGCWWLYFNWSWTHGGRTVGMRAWRLHIEGRDGKPPDWGAATLRYFGAALSLIVLGLGFVWALLDHEGLTWHDRISATTLRYRPRSAQPDDGDERDQQ